ncbi:hypothetical protein ISH75_28930, partial [Pseudomonas aeruginosa]|nr:hypothetical protein [Pseudomonas aeruginosa]
MHKEIDFENDIEHALISSGGYEKGDPKTYDPDTVRIPRHPATQSTLIWPGIPRPSGHLFHGHPAGQSERS